MKLTSLFAILISGVLFGFGLALATMIRPSSVRFIRTFPMRSWSVTIPRLSSISKPSWASWTATNPQAA